MEEAVELDKTDAVARSSATARCCSAPARPKKRSNAPTRRSRSIQSSRPPGHFAAASTGGLEQTERALADLQRSLQYRAGHERRADGHRRDLSTTRPARSLPHDAAASARHVSARPRHAACVSGWKDSRSRISAGPSRPSKACAPPTSQGPPNADILYYLAQAQSGRRPAGRSDGGRPGGPGRQLPRTPPAASCSPSSRPARTLPCRPCVEPVCRAGRPSPAQSVTVGRNG